MNNILEIFKWLLIVVCASMLVTACALIQPNPPFSDSHVIAFASQRDFQDDIYILELATMALTNISNTLDVNEREPNWSPDLSNIVYVVSGIRDHWLYIELEMLNLQSGSVERLSSEVGIYGDPAFSPDSSKILFWSNKDADLETSDLTTEIYVMDASNYETIRITNTQGDDLDATWSPDGSKIAFISNRSGNKDIYIMDADGSNITNITNSPFEETEPAWSPNGKQLVYVSDKAGNKDLFIINVDGTSETNITNSPSEETEPAWSPDGVWIAFVSRIGDEFGEIYVINPDGNAKTRITNHWADDTSPTWKPIQLSN